MCVRSRCDLHDCVLKHARCVRCSLRQQTHYQLLGLTFLASEADIRSAYKRLALLWHPDRNPRCDRAIAQSQFQAIQQAYSAQLSEPAVKLQEYLTLCKDLLLTPCGLDLQPFSADRMLAGIRHPLLSLLAA